MKLINISGSNGTGKSTRVLYLIKYLESKYSSEPLYYKIFDRTLKEYRLKQAGVVFENGWAFYGRYDNKGSWWGLDNSGLPTHEDRYRFINEVASENNVSIDVLVFEGYFNNRQTQTPNRFRENCSNLTSVDSIVLFYDTPEQLISRTEERGRCRDNPIEWTLNSNSWKDNKDRADMYPRCLKESTDADTVIRLDINAPKDWLVQNYFSDTFEIVTESDEITDEW